MNEEDLIELERLAQVHIEMSAEPRSSSEEMGTAQRAVAAGSTSLTELARASAKAWTATKKATGNAPLEAKLDRAMASILEAGRRVGAEEEDDQAAHSEARDFWNNLRVLRSASLEIREALQVELPIQRVGRSPIAEATESVASKDEDLSGELPRPYVAARAYLSAVNYLFEEGVFASYMQVFEEHGYFEMHEIWALKPMMQLAVLECISTRFATRLAVP